MIDIDIYIYPNTVYISFLLYKFYLGVPIVIILLFSCLDS